MKKQQPNFSLSTIKDDPFKPRSLNIQPPSTSQLLNEKMTVDERLKDLAKKVRLMST